MNESRVTFSKIYHLTDSEIVKSQIGKENLKVGTYVANRVGEIREKTNPEEWMWIPTEVNIADYVTKPMNSSELGSSSEWQLGPRFLKLPDDRWPSKETDCIVGDAEEDNKLQHALLSKIVTDDTPNVNIMDVRRNSSQDKLIRVTARIMNIFKGKSFKGVHRLPKQSELHEAEIIWVKVAQLSIKENWEERFKRLGRSMQDGIIFVGSRIANWMKDNWNKEVFILLPHDHDFTKLCVRTFHEKYHAGIESTLCKMKSVYWIPRARKIIKDIKAKCVMCRKLEKKIVGQSMGPLPGKRLKPSPPFYHSALDLFGQFMIKGTVKRRIKRKVFGVVINCLVTRAVYVDLAEGYDADSFLTFLRRFTSIH